MGRRHERMDCVHSGRKLCAFRVWWVLCIPGASAVHSGQVSKMRSVHSGQNSGQVSKMRCVHSGRKLCAFRAYIHVIRLSLYEYFRLNSDSQEYRTQTQEPQECTEVHRSINQLANSRVIISSDCLTLCRKIMRLRRASRCWPGRPSKCRTGRPYLPA